jgi:predicted metal-dependent enzyme (double-stranded beta helix superfamily)
MNAMYPAPRTALARMLEDIAEAAKHPIAGRDRVMAEALAPHLGEPALLEASCRAPGQSCYARHLLHQNDAAGYAVVSIVWLPGQMSPVHGHRTWCAFGAQSGVLTETFFRPDGETACPVGCVLRRPGDVSHAPADPCAIHRLANLGTEKAISIHVYGVRFDEFGGGVNHVWAS